MTGTHLSWGRVPAWLVAVTMVTPHLIAQGRSVSGTITGGVRSCEVQKGETLRAIAARTSVDPQVIAARNGLSPTAVLAAGRVLTLDNRHIVPAVSPDLAVVINLPQRMLFHFAECTFAEAYPVGVGKPGWPTPVGEFRIVGKEVHPT